MYWANRGQIAAANLDGSNLDVEYVENSQTPAQLYDVCGVAIDASHIYWASAAGNEIGRANIDGTDPIYNFISGASEPCGVAVDSKHIYWANRGGVSIGRATLDGREVQQGFATGMHRPCGVAVDNSFVYWGSFLEDAVGRAELHESQAGPAEAEFVREADGACGVAVDGAHVYWGSYSEAVGRADLNGENANSKFIDGLERPCGVAVNSSQIFWTEDSPSGVIGKAALDGSGIDRSLDAGFGPCGIAVDDRVLPAKTFPVQPPIAAFSVLFERHAWSSHGPVTFLAVEISEPGALRLALPPALQWGTRPRRSALRSGRFKSPGRKWLKIWVRGTQAGKQLRRRVKNNGRVKVSIKAHYAAEGRTEVKTHKVSLLSWHALKASRCC